MTKVFVEQPLASPGSAKSTMYFLWIREEVLEIPFSPSYALKLLRFEKTLSKCTQKVFVFYFYFFAFRSKTFAHITKYIVQKCIHDVVNFGYSVSRLCG